MINQILRINLLSTCLPTYPCAYVLIFDRLKLELKKQQKEKGLNQKGLVGEVATRWGSKYRMVERLYYNREPVQTVLMSGKFASLYNTPYEMNISCVCVSKRVTQLGCVIHISDCDLIAQLQNHNFLSVCF